MPFTTKKKAQAALNAPITQLGDIPNTGSSTWRAVIVMKLVHRDPTVSRSIILETCINSSQRECMNYACPKGEKSEFNPTGGNF